MNDQLLIAIIAAGAALLGAAVGQLGPAVQHWLSVRHDRKKLVRDRFEQFALLAAEIPSMINHGDLTSSGPREVMHAANRLRALALVYLPDLIEPAETFRSCALQLQIAVSKDDKRQITTCSTSFQGSSRDLELCILAAAKTYT